MAELSPIDYATASDDIRAEHDRELALRGRMTNMKRILLNSPADPAALPITRSRFTWPRRSGPAALASRARPAIGAGRGFPPRSAGARPFARPDAVP